MTRLYHREVFWKPRFDGALNYLINPKQPIDISEHQLENMARSDRKHNITESKLLEILFLCLTNKQPYDIFEVETETEQYENITKCVLRTALDDTRDVNIVIRPHVIVTAWVNDKEDVHETLDSTKYYKES